MKDTALLYAAAQAAHYTAKDLFTALKSYHGIILAHPTSAEAGYSRTQIQGIANRVISKDVLLDAQMRLALAELVDQRDGWVPDVAPSEEIS